MSSFAALGIGAGLSALGSFAGAQSGNRAGRQARDFYDKRTDEGANRAGFSFYGYQPYSSLTAGANYASGLDGPGRAAAINDFLAQTGGSVLSQYQALSPNADAMMRGRLGDFNRQTGELWQMHEANQGPILNRYRSAEADVDGYVRGRRDQINRDADTTRRDLDARTGAAMSASGFKNTTAYSDGLRANAREVEEARQDALTNVEEGASDRRVATKTRTADAGARLFSERFGTTANRAGFKDAQVFGDIDRQIGLQQLTPQAIMAFQQGNVMNPWLGQNTLQYYPGYSGAGSFATNAGNALATVGAAQLFRQQPQQQ